MLLDFRRDLSVTAGLDRTESTNTALGSIIANERISALRLGARYAWTVQKRSASVGVKVSQGLDFDEANTSVPGAAPDFTKAGLTLTGTQVIGKRTYLRLRGSAQWAGDSLPANERILYGGAEFGRGFDNAQLSFDRGYAVSIEPAWRPLTAGDFARSEIYLFADYGDGALFPGSLLGRTFDFGSAGIGTRITYKDYGTLGLEYAEPWTAPDFIPEDDPVFTLSWAFRYQP